MIDGYQIEMEKGRREATTERSLRNPEAIADTNDLNRRSEGSITDAFPTAKWANRFLKSAIIQGAAITLLTILFVSVQLLFSSNINIVQFLSLSFEGPAKWIFLGCIFYMILIVAVVLRLVTKIKSRLW
jgi:hypothetical protein